MASHKGTHKTKLALLVLFVNPHVLARMEVIGENDKNKQNEKKNGDGRQTAEVKKKKSLNMKRKPLIWSFPPLGPLY